jgi:hypothetical protein
MVFSDFIFLFFNSNADRASWWELMVLASHAHPSVATMAGTLLSGANIVYNGNPLNDLSLTAFLDKFMEKKPKQTAWHGGSQIEPAKKVSHHNWHLLLLPFCVCSDFFIYIMNFRFPCHLGFEALFFCQQQQKHQFLCIITDFFIFSA